MAIDAFLNACPPPWHAFPDIRPQELEAYLNQGLTEAWFDQRWRPFWLSLTSVEREQYLEHWSASPDWRAAMGVFTAHEEIDLKAEWAEFQEQLKQPPAERRRRSFWSRLLRRP